MKIGINKIIIFLVVAFLSPILFFAREANAVVGTPCGTSLEGECASSSDCKFEDIIPDTTSCSSTEACCKKNSSSGSSCTIGGQDGTCYESSKIPSDCVNLGSCSDGKTCCKKSSSNGGGNSSSSVSKTDFENMEKIPGQKQTSDLVEYLNSIYTFGIAISAILAIFMITLGGFMYIVTSAGNASKASNAKDMIFSAIYGLILALVAWLLLFVINPDLIEGTLTGVKTTEDVTKENADEEDIDEYAKGCTDSLNSEIEKQSTKFATSSFSAEFIESTAKKIVRCGEGCNPNVSSAGACGFFQVIEEPYHNRSQSCGLSSDVDESCKQMQESVESDTNCGLTILVNYCMKKCGTDLEAIARCYNGGQCDSSNSETDKYANNVLNCE